MLVSFLSLLALSAFLPAALSNITISDPSSTLYWVQFQSNTISWGFDQGDPSPISIIITNSNNSFLNGAFSIAQFVDVSQQTFIVSNVTLKVGTGYVVNFVNPSNASDVFALSDQFEVKPNGTTLAPTPSHSSSSSTSDSQSGSPSGTQTGGGPALGTAPPNAAARLGTNGALSLAVGVLSVAAGALVL